MKNSKKIKRAVAFLVTMGVIMGTLCGCQKGDEANSGKTKNLKWLMIGPSKQQDSDMVWEEFNKKLNETIPGVNVNFEIIPPAEYVEKWQLMMSASENIDIAWTGYLLSTAEQIKKGALMDMTDAVNKNGKDMLSEIPQFLWDLTTFDGKIYGVANRQCSTDMRRGLKTHKEDSDVYLDKQKLQDTFYANKHTTQECYDVLEEYLAKLQENGKLYKGASPSVISFIVTRGYKGIVSDMVGVDVYADELKALNLMDMEERLISYKNARNWFEKGYTRKDILGLQNPTADDGKADGYAIWMHQYFDWQADADSKKGGFPVDIIPVDEKSILLDSSSTTTVLPRTCSDPDTAVKIIDLLNTKKGKDLYNLLVYGLEGRHYNKIDENKIEPIGYVSQATSENDYGLFKWVVGNTFNSYLTTADVDGYYDKITEIEENAMESPLAGFVFDSDPVKIEVAQCTAVVAEFADLGTGAVADYEKKFYERQEKLKTAGIDKIVAEVQRQLDEWQKNK